jgi:hypothetical protein
LPFSEPAYVPEAVTDPRIRARTSTRLNTIIERFMILLLLNEMVWVNKENRGCSFIGAFLSETKTPT